jgi:HK97 family phage prohead protease
MELGCISVPLELKFAGAECPPGYFEGYGAIFGNVDQGGDMIERGAFAKSLSTMAMTGGKPSMYYNHDRKAGTIGVWDSIEEDANGLVVKGRLIGLDTEQGKMNMARLKEGAIKGLSIGYRVPPHGSRKGSGRMGEPARIIKEIDLKEVSIVDDPMNPLARVNFIKSASGLIDPHICNPRELEDALRDEAKLSRRDAKAAVAVLCKMLPRDAEEVAKSLRDEAPAADVLAEHLRKRMGALAEFLSR